MTRSLIRQPAGLAAGVALAAMALGCSPQLPATPPAITDQVHTGAPDSVKATTGRIEEGSGRVASPAKRTAKLARKSLSADRTLPSPANPDQGVESINAAPANSIEKGLSEIPWQVSDSADHRPAWTR